MTGELTIGCTDVVLQSRTPEIYKMLLTNVTTIIKKENKAKKKKSKHTIGMSNRKQGPVAQGHLAVHCGRDSGQPK